MTSALSPAQLSRPPCKGSPLSCLQRYHCCVSCILYCSVSLHLRIFRENLGHLLHEKEEVGQTHLNKLYKQLEKNYKVVFIVLTYILKKKE